MSAFGSGQLCGESLGRGCPRLRHLAGAPPALPQPPDYWTKLDHYRGFGEFAATTGVRLGRLAAPGSMA